MWSYAKLNGRTVRIKVIQSRKRKERPMTVRIDIDTKKLGNMLVQQ